MQPVDNFFKKGHFLGENTPKNSLFEPKIASEKQAKMPILEAKSPLLPKK